ncbi:MAG: transcriptional regulator [Puniceicoccaceae bacterium]|nr:MAG: transcriptional regulator [Puniceicoccaceae bacterium]
MNATKVYRCLCDETRLRILNLLLEGPLCVCHLSSILGLEQPKISRHLKALKESGAVETERCYNWTICRIPENPSALLETNLKCLQDLRSEERAFAADLRKRRQSIRGMVGACEDLPRQIRDLVGQCPA